MALSAPPTVLVLFVAFLVAMPLVALVSSRLRFPCTVGLVLAGLVVSALPIHEAIQGLRTNAKIVFSRTLVGSG